MSLQLRNIVSDALASIIKKKYRLRPLLIVACLIFFLPVIIRKIIEQIKASKLARQIDISKLGKRQNCRWLNPDLELSSHNDTQTVAVFYNVFTASQDDIPRVRNIVSEQTAQATDRHKIFVNTIGEYWPIVDSCNGCQHVQHCEKASEELSIDALWNYCRRYPDRKVAYMHSKGSYHYHQENEDLRKILTRALLSNKCLNLPGECNVCSAHFSPMPHMHTPGNMWLGRCSYISRLMEPRRFQFKMNELIERYSLYKYTDSSAFIGAGRFAMEHWVHSHPDVRPCDVFNVIGSLQGYHNLDNFETWKLDQSLAPRHPIEFYAHNIQDFNFYTSWSFDLNARVAEWDFLYGILPSQNSWIWPYYTTKSLLAVRKELGPILGRFSWVSRKDVSRLMDNHQNVSLFE